MRKHHQKMLLELLGTLSKASGNLTKNVLADCQDSAEQIFDFIEQLNGDGTTTASYIKEYYELLYEASTELDGVGGNLNSIAEKLRKQIAKIENSVKTDLKPNKIEVAFLPYKASMWDSLESIYLAAKEDPACEAYVVPIPYYDKAGGKFTEMHWETGYPKNIPLADYRKYNIEERHPDIIFVHNPYDGYNHVTSVHPDFYSERLRNLTDCLVYVPYFVGSGLTMGKHFCTLPGCIFAHKVIVQTEDERKIYAKTYKEYAKKNKVFERFDEIEKKFLALGSPKLDKAISAKREDYEMPPEWQNFVGAGSACPAKKIIFYNTTIAALLEHTVEDGKPSNKYLQKIKSVFEFFKSRDDVVLLWRPHPLLESAIKSMRPWLAQEYAEIVNEFKSGGYGIYDDSEDLNRAIAVSDAYYGDGSSVARLFEAAGKLVVGQMFTLPSIYGLYADENSVWFMDSCNGLYKYDKQSGETECMGVIPADNYHANVRIAENNRKLYFAPYYKNNKISVYDIEKKDFEQIAFKDDCNITNKFHQVIPFKNFSYFIPCEFSAIIRLNTDTKEIEYFSDWADEVLKLQTSKLHEDWKVIFFGFCVVESEIAMVMHGANVVMFFNMETGGYKIKHIGEKSEQYNEICFYGQNYYIASIYKDYVVKWNWQSNDLIKIKFPTSFSRKTNACPNFVMQYSNECIWLFPHGASKAYKINANTNEVSELPELIEHFENKDIDWYYNNIFADENFIYASTNGKGTVEYNINTRELNFIKHGSSEEIALLHSISNCKSKISEINNAGSKIWEYFKCK